MAMDDAKHVYAVVYGNYEPPETTALFVDSEEAALFIQEGCNAEAMWEIVKMRLYDSANDAINQGA